ncbi:hypothetical protein QBC38DRAFT_182255 [Podospora fimiseda]|uniref:DUF2415 domain-containing protein n=1 Tax=Podospora fimiseda TaxID=252190 RepID=A0AAN7BQU9_9PEZI|nr:hypothetical protein QBC38DRAFT_182255 [Podospora fimiseda]
MAVTDNSYNPTEQLILATPRRRYRTGVRWQHWQLRSLLGSKGQNAIYFPVASGSESHPFHIRQLNTTTGEQETVKHLGFVPMCLVARNGWVCAGGEKGAFAAFRVGETAEDMSVDDRLSLAHDRHLLALGELDERHPIPLDSPASEEAILASLARARAEKNMLARNRIFGKQRINGITMWFPPTVQKPCKGAYDQGVAVLASNDKGVTIISLREQDVLDDLKYPDFMNLAVISPDGQLLAAISDDPFLYIHQRTEKDCEKADDKRRPWEATTRQYEWKKCGRIQLISQSKDDRSDHRSIQPYQEPFRTHVRRLTVNRGSFAACFSSTGKYLAVGTQYGTISIFKVAALTLPGVDPLITHFKTSRPDFCAVRSMEFSPGPTDLLAWTEDRGRVGIADSRTGFDSRQIIHIDQGDYETIAVTDRSTIDPRLLEQRSDRTRGSLEASNSAATSDRPSRTPDLLENLNIPLTAEETVVLEAIQDHRRRQNQWSSNISRLGAENPTGSGTRGGIGNGNGNGNGSRTARRTGAPPSGTRAEGEGGSRRGPPAWPGRDISRAVDDILDTIRAREFSRTRYLQSLGAAERAAVLGTGATTSTSSGDRSAEDSSGSAALAAAMTNGLAPPERRRYDPSNFFRAEFSRTPASQAEISSRLARYHHLAALSDSTMSIPPIIPTVPTEWDSTDALYGPSVFLSPGSIQPATASAARRSEGRWASSISGTNRRLLRTNYLMRDLEEDSNRRYFGSVMGGLQGRPEPFDTAGLSWSENGDIIITFS